MLHEILAPRHALGFANYTKQPDCVAHAFRLDHNEGSLPATPGRPTGTRKELNVPRSLTFSLTFCIAGVLGSLDTKAEVTLTREGILVSSKVEAIASPVSATVMRIAAAGSRVKQGNLLIALDDSSLNSSLQKQEQAATTAAASLARAKQELNSLIKEQALDVQIADGEIELAELAKQTSLGPEGKHQQSINDAKANLERAKLALKLAELRYEPYQEDSEEKSTEAAVAAKLSVAIARDDVTRSTRQLTRLKGHDTQQLEATLELSILKGKLNRLRIIREHVATKLSVEKIVETRTRALASITKRLQQLEESVAQCQIFAPFDGVVQGPNNNGEIPQIGSFLRKDSPVITFVRTDSMELELRISEIDVARVDVGQNVNIRLSNSSDEPIRGQVARIYRRSAGDIGDSGSEEYNVRISFQEDHPALRLGLKVKAEIEAAQ